MLGCSGTLVGHNSEGNNLHPRTTKPLRCHHHVTCTVQAVCKAPLSQLTCESECAVVHVTTVQ
jgi:hypothetical protein